MLINKVKNHFSDDVLERKEAARLVSFLNPYSYLIMRKELELYNKIDSFYCDGILFAKAMQLTGKKFERVSFDMTSLAPRIFHYAQQKKLSIYIIGSEPGVVEKASLSFKALYPGLKFAGLRHGFFDTPVERENFLRELYELAPDIVVVGMGAPAQERFIADLKATGWKGTAFTCGGFLHQTASSGVNYYPAWADRLNLRWLYRMYDEPKLIKRYFIYYPLFFIVFIYDLLSFKFKKV